ncbi:hypothetical protein [Mycolicibacterium gilvum]|uniref:Putative integral membrane protein n=1 Tax=Mycolicibacterium gilvum TaxID=1804 RepID=A0A378SDS4_9MYCO|nr:hypothetical protein [Mycolicibacterium gilvum]MCV7055976.1 hypothetical protein [Mycolicibacterium gilvum]STZ40992.1 putative integral membrane protein [Mycolicibacterium gilvum]
MTRSLLPVAFGVLMTGAAAYRASGPALLVLGAAVAAVVASAWLRPAGTVAVVLVVGAIVLNPSAPLHTVLAGLAATVYLVVLHTAATVPTMVFAVGFGAVAAVVAALPLGVPWLPLIAAPALLAGYLLALRPFTR